MIMCCVEWRYINLATELNSHTNHVFKWPPVYPTVMWSVAHLHFATRWYRQIKTNHAAVS